MLCAVFMANPLRTRDRVTYSSPASVAKLSEVTARCGHCSRRVSSGGRAGGSAPAARADRGRASCRARRTSRNTSNLADARGDTRGGERKEGCALREAASSQIGAMVADGSTSCAPHDLCRGSRRSGCRCAKGWVDRHGHSRPPRPPRVTSSQSRLPGSDPASAAPTEEGRT